MTVCDRGIGLPEENVDRLFTAFYRSDDACRMSGGLGPAERQQACGRAARWTHQAHPREGGGSEFGFALPLTEERPD